MMLVIIVKMLKIPAALLPTSALLPALEILLSPVGPAAAAEACSFNSVARVRGDTV